MSRNTIPDEIDGSEKHLDSRDIEARIDWLEDSEDEDEIAERKALIEFKDDVNTSEWFHGLSFIHDDAFKDHAMELAEGIGALQNCNHWPATCIDWDQAAKELRMDYSSAELFGTTYWYRD